MNASQDQIARLHEKGGDPQNTFQTRFWKNITSIFLSEFMPRFWHIHNEIYSAVTQITSIGRQVRTFEKRNRTDEWKHFVNEYAEAFGFCSTSEFGHYSAVLQCECKTTKRIPRNNSAFVPLWSFCRGFVAHYNFSEVTTNLQDKRQIYRTKIRNATNLQPQIKTRQSYKLATKKATDLQLWIKTRQTYSFD